MNRISMHMAIAVLSLSGFYASAQTVPSDAATPQQNEPDRTNSAPSEEERAGRLPRDGDNSPIPRDGNSPTSDNRPVRDETVGLGSAVDRATPRDIREPFDESAVDLAPRDIREPFDE